MEKNTIWRKNQEHNIKLYSPFNARESFLQSVLWALWYLECESRARRSQWLFLFGNNRAVRRMTRKRLAQPGTQTSAEHLVCTCSVRSPSSQNSKWGFLHFKSSKCRRVWGQRRIIELPCCLHTLLHACYNLRPRECTPGSWGEAGVSQLENSPRWPSHVLFIIPYLTTHSILENRCFGASSSNHKQDSFVPIETRC